MRYSRAVGALLIPIAAAACGDSNTPFGPGPDDPPPSNALTFEWQGEIDSGDHLEIRGINGAIEAVRSSGNQVEVFARKRWDRSDPDEVSFQVVSHPDGVTICAIYPNPLPGRTNECLPGGEGDTRVDGNDVRVDFEIRLPAGVDLVASIVNGSVDASDVESDVSVMPGLI